MPYTLPPPDPNLEEALRLMAKLGCSFGVQTFFPSPERPPSVYPIRIVPPPGFHFDDGLHYRVLASWWHVVDALALATISPCDEECGDFDLRSKA